MNTRELIAHRHGPTQRMVIPVDPDTTRRLERVIAGEIKLSWYRRLLRWLRK